MIISIEEYFSGWLKPPIRQGLLQVLHSWSLRWWFHHRQVYHRLPHHCQRPRPLQHHSSLVSWSLVCNSRSQAISARTPLEIIGCKKISHVPPLLPCRHAEGHLVAQLQHGHLHLARQHVANYRHLAADEASLTDRKVNQPKIWGSQNSEIWFLM